VKSRVLGENVFWIVLALGICAGALQLGLWSPAGPGSGFMPFLAGLLIGLVGVGRLVAAWSRETTRAARFWEDPAAARRVVAVVLALCTMAAVMPILGFLLTAMLVMAFLLRLTAETRLVTVIVLAIVSSLSVYWLFQSVLGVRLPKGLVGF
jgi:putative tricarboxylic transport membrane protein